MRRVFDLFVTLSVMVIGGLVITVLLLVSPKARREFTKQTGV